MFQPRSEFKKSHFPSSEFKRDIPSLEPEPFPSDPFQPQRPFDAKPSDPRALEAKLAAPNKFSNGRRMLGNSPARRFELSKQRRMMVIALSMLLIALTALLYRDRDFWFPDTETADDQEETIAPAERTSAERAAAERPSAEHAVEPAAAAAKANRTLKKKSHAFSVTKQSVTQQQASVAMDAPGMTATTQRTPLPPLEVEVVAGDDHRTLRPGTNSVHLDLQPASPPDPATTPASSGTPSEAPSDASSETKVSAAAERVQMSTDTSAVVTHSVEPGYPLLARQMKVQGSVILQALIGRDGLIQDLRILSGSPILATAAEEAVRQWHFKPHYQSGEAVETQARITVNFTISTN
jgi:TonB family protein